MSQKRSLHWAVSPSQVELPSDSEPELIPVPEGSDFDVAVAAVEYLEGGEPEVAVDKAVSSGLLVSSVVPVDVTPDVVEKEGGAGFDESLEKRELEFSERLLRDSSKARELTELRSRVAKLEFELKKTIASARESTGRPRDLSDM